MLSHRTDRRLRLQKWRCRICHIPEGERKYMQHDAEIKKMTACRRLTADGLVLYLILKSVETALLIYTKVDPENRLHTLDADLEL